MRGQAIQPRSRAEDQTPADRVTGQSTPVTHPELVEDALAMTLDRLDADHQLLGDLLRACKPRRSVSAPGAHAQKGPRRARRVRTALDVVADGAW